MSIRFDWVQLTDHTTAKSVVQAGQLGATNYLEKPFTLEMPINAVTVGLKAEKSTKPEEQRIVHRDEILHVHDRDFVPALHHEGVDALSEYNLTGPEKLAILTGDAQWIAEHAGELSDTQKHWFQQQLPVETW